MSTTALERDVLGTGWRFPPTPGGTGGFELRAGPALVRQSLLIILGTEPGERLMRPDFGCALRTYLMEPNTPATREGIARDVAAAIRYWEPRVELGAVEVLPTDDPSAVLVSVTYTLVRDQSVDAIQVVVQVDASARGRLT